MSEVCGEIDFDCAEAYKLVYRKKRTQDPYQDQDQDPEEDSKEDAEEDLRENPVEDLEEDL